MRIPLPPTANADLKEAIRQVELVLERLFGGLNVDWHGRRIINAGDAVQDQDYVTKAQLTKAENRIKELERAVSELQKDVSELLDRLGV